MSENQKLPIVLVLAGNDPTGGAGIQADIETLASMGCHAAPVITAITVQDTQNVTGYYPMDLSMIVEQARSVLEDMPVAAIKIGMLGSIEGIEAVSTIIQDYPNLPVVFDPILIAGGGTPLADDEMTSAMCSLLIPKSTVLVPNSNEARALAKEADTMDACAQELMDMGAEYVLVTGSHEQTEKVENIFYGNNRILDTFSWDRLPNQYHGSGCTLASAIAGLLAQGLDPLSAVHEAQEYTWKSLESGYRAGMGQFLPDRFFWAQSLEDGNKDEDGDDEGKDKDKGEGVEGDSDLNR